LHLCRHERLRPSVPPVLTTPAVSKESLAGERHAVQRSLEPAFRQHRIRLGGLDEHAFAAEGDHRVDLWVDLVDARVTQLHRVDCRELFLPDHPGDFRRRLHDDVGRLSPPLRLWACQRA
jgi:hypothetical protein